MDSKKKKTFYYKLSLLTAFGVSFFFFFDTAVRSGSWSTSLPESLEAYANWRERV